MASGTVEKVQKAGHCDPAFGGVAMTQKGFLTHPKALLLSYYNFGNSLFRRPNEDCGKD